MNEVCGLEIDIGASVEGDLKGKGEEIERNRILLAALEISKIL